MSPMKTILATSVVTTVIFILGLLFFAYYGPIYYNTLWFWLVLFLILMAMVGVMGINFLKMRF